MAQLIPTTTTASLWMATADLPNTRPNGMASSPDGSTLYVSCAGPAAGSSSIIAIDIATKAVTTIVAGYTYIGHALDVDSAGNLYFSNSARSGYADTPLHVWDGSSVAVKFPASTGRNWWGLAIDGNDVAWSIDYPNWGARLVSRSLGTGTELSYSQGPNDEYAEARGIAVTPSYVVVSGTKNIRLQTWNRSGVTTGNNANGYLWQNETWPYVGVAPVSDTEVYALTTMGYLRLYNPSTNALGGGYGLILPEQDSYSDIHITKGKRVFVTRGGWHSAATDTPTDGAFGSDVGIYELTTSRGGPTVGFIGFGTF